MSVITGYSSQAIPASNTFQPGVSDTGKRTDESKTDKTATIAESQDSVQASESRRGAETSATYRADESSRARDTGSVHSSSSRGTQLDITV